MHFMFEFPVPSEAIDANGHVNNVVFVQWMQDAAIRHCETVGTVRMVQEAGLTWVARSHHVEYLKPVLPHDVVRVETWVADFRRIRSLRRYRFSRVSDGQLAVRGETDWVLVDAMSGKPREIPENVRTVMPCLGEEYVPRESAVS